MSTRREIACLYLIIDTLRIPFEGDLKNASDVKTFIYQNYERAMKLRKQLREFQDHADGMLLVDAIMRDADEFYKNGGGESQKPEEPKSKVPVINLRSLKRRAK